jgi:hypothetical protein
MKKEIDDTTAARIESDAKACSARDLFEGESRLTWGIRVSTDPLILVRYP